MGSGVDTTCCCSCGDGSRTDMGGAGGSGGGGGDAQGCDGSSRGSVYEDAELSILDTAATTVPGDSGWCSCSSCWAGELGGVWSKRE